jgi:hypothetical protein
MCNDILIHWNSRTSFKTTRSTHGKLIILGEELS